MEHIVQFGISIDDDRIRKSVEEQALKSVSDELMAHVRQNLPRKYYSGNETDWAEFATNCGKEFLEEYRDEIIEGAVSKLAASIMRTKKFKEAYGEMEQEVG